MVEIVLFCDTRLLIILMLEPNLLIASFITFFAVCYSFLISKLFKIKLKPVRFESIEGLRGYLAFFVLLHHACIYYYYLRSGNWELPPQNLYIHLGQTSVSLFFMITGFLFFEKLIESRRNKINWFSYFLSRILRLYPLYIVALISMLIIVYAMSDFKRMDKFLDLFLEIKDWVFFGVINTPQINGYEKTGDIISVLWSIRYEWMFYFALPVIGLLFFRQRPNIILVALCVVVCYYIFISGEIIYYHFLSFISGLLAALICKNEKIKSITKHWGSSFFVLLTLIYLVCFFNSTHAIIPWLLTTIVFTAISCGNSIFGLLTLNASKKFGQISYSIYLLHTVLFFIIFRMIFGIEIISKLSSIEYWFLILAISLILIPICYFTYYKIELPVINSKKTILLKLKLFRTK